MQRNRTTERVGHDVDAFAVGELAYPGQEVLALVVDRDRAQRLDLRQVVGRRGPDEPKPGHGAELKHRSADPSGCAVHEHGLPSFRLGGAVEHLVGGHIGEHETDHLGRVKVLGNLDRPGLRHADPIRIRAPDRQRADPIADVQP